MKPLDGLLIVIFVAGIWLGGRECLIVQKKVCVERAEATIRMIAMMEFTEEE